MKKFSVIVDAPSNEELYECGRVIKRATAAGYREAIVFISGVTKSNVEVLQQQLSQLEYVYVMSANRAMSYPMSRNTDSVSLNLDNDQTGIIMNDALKQILNAEFLVIVSSSVDGISKLTERAVKDFVFHKKNIYTVLTGRSAWATAPQYSDSVMSINQRRDEPKRTFVDVADKTSDGAYAELKAKVLPQTIKKFKEQN